MIVFGSALSHHINQASTASSAENKNTNSCHEENDPKMSRNFRFTELDSVNSLSPRPPPIDTTKTSYDKYNPMNSDCTHLTILSSDIDSSPIYSVDNSISHLQFLLGQINAPPIKDIQKLSSSSSFSSSSSLVNNIQKKNTHFMTRIVNLLESNTHLLKYIDQVMHHIKSFVGTLRRGIIPPPYNHYHNQADHINQAISDLTVDTRKSIIFLLIDNMTNLLTITQRYKREQEQGDEKRGKEEHPHSCMSIHSILQEYHSLFDTCELITDKSIISSIQHFPFSFLQMCRELNGKLISAILSILLTTSSTTEDDTTMTTIESSSSNRNHHHLLLLHQDLLSLLETCIQISKDQIPYVQGILHTFKYLDYTNEMEDDQNHVHTLSNMISSHNDYNKNNIQSLNTLQQQQQQQQSLLHQLDRYWNTSSWILRNLRNTISSSQEKPFHNIHSSSSSSSSPSNQETNMDYSRVLLGDPQLLSRWMLFSTMMNQCSILHDLIQKEINKNNTTMVMIENDTRSESCHDAVVQRTIEYQDDDIIDNHHHYHHQQRQEQQELREISKSTFVPQEVYYMGMGSSVQQLDTEENDKNTYKKNNDYQDLLLSQQQQQHQTNLIIELEQRLKSMVKNNNKISSTKEEEEENDDLVLLESKMNAKKKYKNESLSYPIFIGVSSNDLKDAFAKNNKNNTVTETSESHFSY